MKTLHSAIIELTLLAGTAQADVVTDWNQTAPRSQPKWEGTNEPQ